MKKRLFALAITAVVLLASLAFAQSESADTRVFDYAGLFTAGEAETLKAAIIDYQENTGYDFAIMVTDVDHGYDDYQTLCDDFYVSKSLGLGMNRTAILCYLDLYGDGYYYVSVYGDLKNLMVEEDILYLADNAMEYFYDGDFPGGFTWTMNMLAEALLNIGIMDQTTRVFDYAEVLSDEDVETLEAAIADSRALSGRDFLYLSTYEDLAGNETGDYMFEFYEKHGFGSGEERSGVAIYLDLFVGSYYVQNFGDMDTFVSQDSLNTIVANCNELLGEGKILPAVLQVIGDYSAYFQ
ncbi:MAG: TPM domain-containing protein [Bacillota bacterium]